MLIFQQPLLQSSMQHYPSEFILICWFGAQETFIIIINVENGIIYNYYLIIIIIIDMVDIWYGANTLCNPEQIWQ